MSVYLNFGLFGAVIRQLRHLFLLHSGALVVRAFQKSEKSDKLFYNFFK